MTNKVPGFGCDPNTAVFVCQKVLSKASPVVRVSHDANGDWQFLCDRDHQVAGDPGKIICLREALTLDASLCHLGEVPKGSYARRSDNGAAWFIVDTFEESILSDIAQHGWHLALVEAGDEPGQGPFGYTIGLEQSYGSPEIICFGPHKMIAGILHACVTAMKQTGRPFAAASLSDDVLEGYPVSFRAVLHSHHPTYVGYAMWFHRHSKSRQPLRLLQCYWPDASRRFPWELNCEVAGDQPRLDLP